MFPLAISAQSGAVVLFDFDKYTLTGPGRKLLDSILKIPSINLKKIRLYGHTDAVGDFSYNDVLSTKRVSQTKQYLLRKGINPSKIVTDSGFGKRRPLNNNYNSEERQANRRVEIVLENPISTLQEKITDSATTIGSTIIVKDLNFIGGRHTLMKHSWPVLQDLLRIMRKFPSLEIEIHGHVCCTGGSEGFDYDENEVMLSINRAVYIYKYLIDNGISAKRLSWKAFKGSKPLHKTEDTEERRMLNRRVEIKIIKK
jgi:outer membrane protein OmpA-like peptidoglycan-associated protein